MKKIFKIFVTLSLLFLFEAESLAYQNNLSTLFRNNRANIYELNIRTFNAVDLNGDDLIDESIGEEKGTFLNAIERLDELRILGFNAIHLLPIMEIGKTKAMGQAGSLYALKSFENINLQLDDTKNDLSVYEEAKIFIDECHKRGIHVIVDLPACGSYDMFLENENLFEKHSNGTSVIPADWLDVRLFKTLDKKGRLNYQLYNEHLKFVNLMLELQVDGIRADVATIKPYEFWKKLINYTKSKDKEFLFLAEASDSWTEPVAKEAIFTNYEQLLKSGFDGFYGSWFNFKNVSDSKEFENFVIQHEKIMKKFKNQKSTIGSFSTHDELSPFAGGKDDFAIQTIWLNAVLNLNPYFVDGIFGKDEYDYKFANKKLSTTFTDDDFAFVHKGKIDIFNFSRSPKKDNEKMFKILKSALEFRKDNDYIIQNSNINFLKTTDYSVAAFERKCHGKKIVVILNLDRKRDQNNVYVFAKPLAQIKKIYCDNLNQKFEKNRIETTLKAGEIQVFLFEEVN